MAAVVWPLFHGAGSLLRPGAPDLANHFRGQAAEPLRGGMPVAVAGEAGSLMFDLMLTSGKSRRFLPGRGVFTLVGKLPDGVGDHVEQASVLLAE